MYVNAGAISTIRSATMPTTISSSSNVNPPSRKAAAGRGALSRSRLEFEWSCGIDPPPQELRRTGRYSIVRGHPFAKTRAGLLGANIEGAYYTENQAVSKC